MNTKIFNGNNLPPEILLTRRQKTKLRNEFQNNMSTNMKFSKAQLSKKIQSGQFSGSLLSKLAGPLMKVVAFLANNIFAQLGIAAVASAIDARIQKKIHGFGTKTLVISNEKMNDIMKIIQVLEDFNILWEGLTKKTEN